MALGKEFSFFLKKETTVLKRKKTYLFAECRRSGLGKAQIKKNPKSSAFFLKKLSPFPSAPLRHSAKSLCRVPELGTRQSIYFFVFASKLFLQPLHIKLKYILKFGTFLDLFAIYP